MVSELFQYYDLSARKIVVLKFQIIHYHNYNSTYMLFSATYVGCLQFLIKGSN